MILQRRKLAKTPRISKKKAPKDQPWNGVPMVRNQSFLASVKEIIDYSDEMDVVRIGLIGDMMSGKTTLSQAIGHAIHKYSKIPFSIRIFYKKNLQTFKETISKLEPANYVLIFDDVSFLKSSTSSQGISMIEDEVSTIRHMGDDPSTAVDVKIILIFNFHYPKALPPFLREFQFKYITTIGTDNERVMADNYGVDNVKLVKSFKSMRKKAITAKAWFENVGKDKPPVRYLWRKPFIPVLFWNEATMRKVVTPTRYFMDEVCSICSDAEGIKSYDEKELMDILAIGEKKHTKGSFLSAIKIILKMHGFNAYNGNIERAIKWISRERNIRNIPLEALISHYGLKNKNRRIGIRTDETKI